MVVAHTRANGLSVEIDRQRRAREESRGFRQQPKICHHLVAYHLAPEITDFILHQIQKCCYKDLEQTLTLLHSGRCEQIGKNWSKTQYIIHSSSATQSTRKVRSSCVETCGAKCPRYQQLHMILVSLLSKKRH